MRNGGLTSPESEDDPFFRNRGNVPITLVRSLRVARLNRLVVVLLLLLGSLAVRQDAQAWTGRYFTTPWGCNYVGESWHDVYGDVAQTRQYSIGHCAEMWTGFFSWGFDSGWKAFPGAVQWTYPRPN